MRCLIKLVALLLLFLLTEVPRIFAEEGDGDGG